MATIYSAYTENKPENLENVDNIQLAFVGDKKVGKTSFIRAINGKIDESYVPTIQYNVFNYYTKILLNNKKKEKPIHVIVWDFGDSIKYQSLIDAYLDEMNAIVLFYDLSDKKSIQNIYQYYLHFKSIKHTQNVKKFVIGCKNDIAASYLAEEYEKMQQFCQEYGITHYKCSAKEESTISIFDQIIDFLVQQKPKKRPCQR